MKNMRKFKITSLILVVVMLIGMVPTGMFAAIATETERAPQMPSQLPDGSEYHSVVFYEGDNYEKGGDQTTDAWATADGMILVFDTLMGDTGAGNNFNCMLRVTDGFSATSSYVRLDTLPTQKDLNDYQGYDTFSYCMYDGQSWEARRLSGHSALKTTSMAATTAMTEEGYTYVYIPMETFRFMGAGAGVYTGYGENQDIAWMRELIGAPATEVRHLFEQQTANVSFDNGKLRYGGKDLPIVRIDFVYKTTDASRPADSTLSQIPLTGTEENGFLKTEGGINALLSGNRLTVTHMPVNSETSDTRVFLHDLNAANASTDLSGAEGIQVNVDSSALGTAKLHLKLNLKMNEIVPKDLFPNNTTILNAYGKIPTGEKVSDGKEPPTEYTVYSYYEDFSSLVCDHANNKCYCVQFSTRAGAAVAYITGTDSAGHTYTNEPVYTTGKMRTVVSSDLTHSYGPTYSNNGDGSFVLPAGFKGSVYIPMSSYYLNVYGSYNSGMLLPFEQSPVQAFDSVGFFSTVEGTPAANKVVYENFSIVNRTGDVIIDNENEFMSFAQSVAAGNDYAGKVVKLNADLTFNKTWNAFAETVTKPEKVYPDMSGATFAGTFDGQGHTISGLYMEGSSFCGFFGNVASGTTATVKNLDIINSYIGTKDAQGVGGIFGQVEADVVDMPKQACYHTATHATIDNVYLAINIFNDASGNDEMGTGGFIGGTRSEVTISKSVFAGQVKSGKRGVSAFIGSTLPYVANYKEETDVSFYRMDVRLTDCANLGALVGVDGNQNFLGAIVGYAGGITENFYVSNFVSTGTIADADDSMSACNGYLIGGGWATTNSKRIASRADGSAAPVDYQRWCMKDVYYVETSGSDFGVIGNSFPAFCVGYAQTGVAVKHYTNAGFANSGIAKKTMEELPGVLFVRYGNFEQGLLMNDGMSISVSISDRDLIAVGDKATATLGVGASATQMSAFKQNGVYNFAINHISPKDLCKNYDFSMIIDGTRVVVNASLEDLLADLISYENPNGDKEIAAAQVAASEWIRYAKEFQTYHAAKMEPTDVRVNLAEVSVKEPILDDEGNPVLDDNDEPTYNTIRYTELTTVSGRKIALKDGLDGNAIEAVNKLSFSSYEGGYGWYPRVSFGDSLALEIEINPEREYVAMIGDRLAHTEEKDGKLIVYVYAYELNSTVLIIDDMGNSMTCAFADAMAMALKDDSGIVTDAQKSLLKAMSAYCQAATAFAKA